MAPSDLLFGARYKYSYLLGYTYLVKYLIRCSKKARFAQQYPQHKTGYRIAYLGPVPSLCYSRYTGCQSASASDTKLPLWRSRFIGCHRRLIWIRCWTFRLGLSDHPAHRVWSCRGRAQNLPSERSRWLHLLCGTVYRSMPSTLTLYLCLKNT